MKIILNILTHGDEMIGLKVAKEIQKLNIDKNILTIQIANEKAFKSRKKFIDQDLNRSFPGKKNGNHEERLAYRLSPIIRSANIVIDIHSTKSEVKDSIIVTKLDNNTQKCIDVIQPKYVLIMNSTKDNALISQAKIGIAFEYGKDDDANTTNKIVTSIKGLLRSLNIIEGKLCQEKSLTEYFNVSSVVKKPKGYKLLKGIKNYKLVHKGDTFAIRGDNCLVAKENFYPILFSDKGYTGIFGFSGEKYNINK